MALVGYVDLMSRHGVSGWAADSDRSDDAVEVSVFLNGKEVHRGVANQRRLDLLQDGWSSIDHGFAVPLPSLPEDQANHVLVCHSATLAPLPNGEIIFRAETPKSSTSLPRLDFPTAEHQLQPILLTGVARSGTTMLAKRLADHPNIVVADLPPYELMLMAYYAAAFKVLTLPGDHERSINSEELGSNPYFIGRNPFFHFTYLDLIGQDFTIFDYFTICVRETLGTAFRKLTKDFYVELARQQGKIVARYFLEKGLDLLHTGRGLARELFPYLREVILVRDVRDVLCSQRAFDSRRATQPVSSLREDIGKLMDIRREHDLSIHFVRYEDLLLRERETINGITDFLGLDSFAREDKESLSTLFTMHATSASPEQSIGRWRRDLTTEEQELCHSEFCDFLVAFGYDFIGDASECDASVPDALINLRRDVALLRRETARLKRLIGDCDEGIHADEALGSGWPSPLG